jgi:hypothetical protein
MYPKPHEEFCLTHNPTFPRYFGCFGFVETLVRLVHFYISEVLVDMSGERVE